MKWFLIIVGSIILLAGVFYLGMRSAVHALFEMALAFFGFTRKDSKGGPMMSEPTKEKRPLCSCGFPQSSPIPHEHDRTGRGKQIINHYECLIEKHCEREKKIKGLKELADKILTATGRCDDCPLLEDIRAFGKRKG